MHESQEHSRKNVEESLQVLKNADDFERETAIIWLDNAILECEVEELQNERLDLVRTIQELKGEIKEENHLNVDDDLTDERDADLLEGDLIEELDRV